ncbi:MAG TPA: PAS domain S-box protein [Ramlibacter sp.]|nr:PAS domain S-box protein [Ramlibacter sp.]
MGVRVLNWLFGGDQTELLRALAQESEDCIYAKDLDCRITYANPATLALFGKPPAEVLGHRNDELPADKRVLETGEPTESEIMVPLPDGTARWWWARQVPIRDAGGRITGLLGISRDITERKQHEEQQETIARQWRLALDAAGLGWWQYNLAERALDYDPRIAAMFGVDKAQASGEDLIRQVHPEDLANLQDAVGDALRSRPMGTFTVQFRVRRSTGEERWIEAHGMPLPSRHGGRAKCLIGTVADITERNKIEQALRDTNAKLQEAHGQKDEFIATLAHELRNPLAPLRNIVELLKTKEEDPVVHRLRPVMERQIVHLTRLVDDLLDVSRISRGAMHLNRQVLDLGEVARASADPLLCAMEAANIAFEMRIETPAPHVLGDETRLMQCVTNLLTNALKFTHSGGRITLGVRHEGALAVLELRDTGSGISPDNLERIFQLFVQDQPMGFRGTAGLGIGLALTRRLVELHGGTVRAFSRGHGFGSKFRIELPLAAQAGLAPAPSAAPQRPDVRDVTVLVVDDNEDSADSLREMLNAAGYKASCAYTGQAALDAIAEDKPDVALLDIGLPDIDGYEVCRRVRSQSGTHQPVLIAVTGWGQERDKERATASGFNGHLTKPADPGKLMAMLREMVSTSRRPVPSQD